MNLKKHMNRKGAENAKGKTMCCRIGEGRIDIMTLFCELGIKPPTAYPISSRLRAFAVNELRFLG
jgi:hypothetical protein